MKATGRMQIFLRDLRLPRDEEMPHARYEDCDVDRDRGTLASRTAVDREADPRKLAITTMPSVEAPTPSADAGTASYPAGRSARSLTAP
jgi:hypothetical protein